MERWVAKVICMVLVFIFPTIVTISPIYVNDSFSKLGQKGERYLSYMMCFGGGVFFATYLLGMIPEVSELLDEAWLWKEDIGYPIPELITGLGFIMILTIENIAVTINENNKAKRKAEEEKKAADQGADSKLLKSGEKDEYGTFENGDPSKEKDEDPKVAVLSASHRSENLELAALESRSVVLIVALSLHRAFESMSIGLKTTTSDVWSLFVAIMLHELVIGFSLGLQFVRNKFPERQHIFYSIVTCAVLPLGVGIGTLITELSEESDTLDIINGVLQAIATGTFIYVTFFEILPGEFGHDNTNLMKILFLFFGYSMMAIVALMTDQLDEEDEDEYWIHCKIKDGVPDCVV